MNNISKVGNYFIGVDAGTNSTGIFSGINENGEYKDTEYKSIIFPRAERSKARRLYRSSRYRMNRKKKRQKELIRYFKEEIKKVDKDFFVKLKQQSLKNDDKLERIHDLKLFDYEDYSNEDFRKEYPTINHLIMDIINDNVKRDKYYALKVFLCIYYLFGKRGHFYFYSLDENNITNTKETYQSVCNLAKENNIAFFEDEERFLSIYMSDLSNIEKIKKIKELTKDKQKIEIAKALFSMKFNIKNINPLYDLKFDFNSSNIDENLEDLRNLVDEEFFNFIYNLKMYHDNLIVKKMLKDYSYLSEVMVNKYNKYHEDLVNLKYLVKKYEGSAQKNLFFSKECENGYYKFSVSKKKEEVFYSAVKEKLENYLLKADELDKNLIMNTLERISEKDYFLKINSSENAVIPMQLHLKELKCILNQAEKSLSFLNEKVENSENTYKDRIISLFSFTTPYYMGHEYKFEWEYSKEDYVKAQENFMNNLVQKCTYLPEYNVLPKNSLLYEKYCVLNEINNIRINSYLISTELKQEIFTNLYQKDASVSLNKVKKYLIEHDYMNNDDVLSGLPEKVYPLTMYHKLKKIFNLSDEKEYKEAEYIILLKTIYGKEISNFSYHCKKLGYTDKQIQFVKNLEVSGWGKLSKELLTYKGYDKENQKEITLMDALWETNNNFNELIYNDNFTFIENIKATVKRFDNKNIFNIKYEDIANLGYPNDVNRMVWILIKEVRDIVKKNGEYPKSMYLESPRGIDNSPENKSNRYKKLSKLYAEAMEKVKKKDIQKYNELKELKDELENHKDAVSASDKIYLYFLQCGRNFYGNGEKLNLESYEDYQKDHIIPKSVSHTNELDDLVLTTAVLNQKKEDFYPICEAEKQKGFFVSNEAREIWDFCFKNGFINSVKYNRLIREEGLKDYELRQFQKNQLVSTAQAIKLSTNILEELMPFVQIKYVKAEKVSDFRKQFKLYKDRDINHYHHAEDALLSAVIGNNIYTDPYFDGKKDVFCKGVKTWDTKKSLSSIKEIMNKKPKVIVKTFLPKGSLYNMTVYSSKDNSDTANVCTLKKSGALSNTNYGIRKSLTSAGAIYIEHELNGQKIEQFVRLPLIDYEKYKSLGAELYCKNLGYQNVTVIKDLVKINDILTIDNFPYYFGGFSLNRVLVKPAREYSFSKDMKKYVFSLKKYIRYIDTVENYNKKKSKNNKNEEKNTDCNEDFEMKETNNELTKNNMNKKNKEEIMDGKYIIKTKKPEILSKDNNLKLYELLEYEFGKGCYKNKKNNVYEKLVNHKSDFLALSETEQYMQLTALLNLISVSTNYTLDKEVKNNKGINLNILGIINSTVGVSSIISSQPI